MRARIRMAAVVGGALLAGCAHAPLRVGDGVPGDLPSEFDRALAAEARDPLAAEGYLHAIDLALERWNDPWAAPVVTASLDRLVWRSLAEMPASVEHAIVHRSRETFATAVDRLSLALARAEGHPILRPTIAFALQELALRTGAAPEAAEFRRAAGCVERATVVGPLGWPPLAAIDEPLPLPVLGPLPHSVPGLPPFSSRLPFERSYADACALDLDATGSASGARALVVDAIVRRPGWVYATVGSKAALRVEIGGAPVVRRVDALTDGTALSFGRAWVEPGRARVVVRVAAHGDDDEVSLQLVTEEGSPIETLAPEPGDIATVRASRGETIEIVPAARRREETITAAATELALGLDRRAARRLDGERDDDGAPVAHHDLLRLHAWRVADEWPEALLASRVRRLATRARATCPTCWEARLILAQDAVDRGGGDLGVFAGLSLLGVSPHEPALDASTRGAPELAFLALAAARANLRDVARVALDALAASAPDSALLADVDAQVTPRRGPERSSAACNGGQSRSGSACMSALVQQGDLRGTLQELARLRRLRGSPALFRRVELAQLLAHGDRDRAARLYDALPPASRDSALLAILEPRDARGRLLQDELVLGDAPFGLEPLARLVGATPDLALALEQEGAELIARDRRNTFLPDAGTAVLRHVERYDLNERGLLLLWTYDLRRVSDTEDVASGAEAEPPRVSGRWVTRVLRRRIHKHDGRVLDPDPNAEGAQGHADLSQLERGDYVEHVRIGWALPDDHGQLVVDGPDAMPERTSVREALVELRRPRSLPLRIWGHDLLGPRRDTHESDRIVSRWEIRDRAPRRLEDAVPDEEDRVGISFGTDSIERMARAIAEHARLLSEPDPAVAQWARQALEHDTASLDPRATIDRLTAAVGRAVREADAAALTDRVANATPGVGDPPRRILELRSGSRSLVLLLALRSLGFRCELALAEGRAHSPAPEMPPHVGRFTHPLVRVLLDGRWLWIDADVDGPPLPPGRISPELRGRSALGVDGRVDRLEASREDDADTVDLALDVDGEGFATGTFRATLRGRAAQRMAGELERRVGGERGNLLRGIVLAWVPWADVADVRLESDERAWEVSLSARLGRAPFAQPEDSVGHRWTLPGIDADRRLFPGPATGSLASRYAAQADRAASLAIEAPLFYRVRRHIRLPEGTAILSSAPEWRVESPEVSARRAVSVRDRAVEEEFELSLPAGVVAPAGHDTFAERIRRIDEGFAHGTRATMGER